MSNWYKYGDPLSFKDPLSPFYDWYGTRRLGQLCAYGAEQVKAGKADALKFELFDSSERDFVKQYMADNFPTIKFYTTHIADKPEAIAAAIKQDVQE